MYKSNTHKSVIYKIKQMCQRITRRASCLVLAKARTIYDMKTISFEGAQLYR